MPKNPPFEITEEILSLVAEISELVGQLSSGNRLSSNPTLRRRNRIQTIYGSLAIEQNTLSLEQITAVLNGKRVMAPPRDIAEVKNAYDIYERMEALHPFAVEDLLMAHRVMMGDLIEESGMFRSRPVGVVNGEGYIVHFGTLPEYVPDAVENLLIWTQESTLPMLVKSCVFHYELELIHPFTDGNGRMGRLWHTLLLSHWNQVFAWLPVESIVHDRQDAYYEAINMSNDMVSSTPFITFMLSAILSAIQEAIHVSDEMSDEVSDETTPQEVRWMKIQAYLKNHDSLRNADLCRMLAVSPATARRLLHGWVEDGRLERHREGKTWAYRSK